MARHFIENACRQVATTIGHRWPVAPGLKVVAIIVEAGPAALRMQTSRDFSSGSRARMRDRVARFCSSSGTVRRCQNAPRSAA